MRNCSFPHHLKDTLYTKPLWNQNWPTNHIWCWTFIGSMLLSWWLANIVPILARWTKLCWPNIGLTMSGQCFLLTLAQHWPNFGLKSLLGWHWSTNHDGGKPTLGQYVCWRWPRIGPILVCYMKPLFGWHWPTNEDGGQPRLGQCFCWCWPTTGPKLYVLYEWTR